MRKKCEICGQEFKTNGNAKYCKSCRERIVREYDEHLKQTKRTQHKTCIVCGRKIERGAYLKGNRGHVMTCCNDCQHVLQSLTASYRYQRGNELKRKRRGIAGKRKSGERSFLAICEDEARKLGITYGEYMARRRMAAERAQR